MLNTKGVLFPALIEFMTSGPVMVQVLEGNAIAKNRELMGATNPQEADAGTIRADFAESIDANAVHGSDALNQLLAKLLTSLLQAIFVIAAK